MSSWIEIAERAQQALEAGKAHRERLAAVEQRMAKREQRKPAPAPTKAPTVTPAAPAIDKKQAAWAAVTAFVTGAQLIEPAAPAASPAEPTGDAPKPIAGTFTAKLVKREARDKARADEKTAAIATIDKWLGRGVR
jgi:hypothetical protein